MKKNILLWSPFIGNIGTKRAVINSAKAISKYSNHKIFLLNVLGEFNDFNDENIEKINIFNVYSIAPTTGFFSKLFILIFSFLSIPFLFWIIKKKKINLILSFLLGIFPLFVKQFFKNVKIIMSIQGFPKFTFMRTILWKIFYTKAYKIFTMSNLTKNLITQNINYNNTVVTNNPIISRELSILSKEKLNNFEKKIFSKKVIICVGRLTRQKRLLDVIRAIKNLDKQLTKNFNLLILGEGEQKQLIINEARKHNIKNIFLLGHKSNPFKYIANSEIFISSSLWEDPGHALIESAYLNTFIITSECEAGPKEMFSNKFNCLSYPPQDVDMLTKQLKVFFQDLTSREKFSMRLQAKKLSKNYTEFMFYKSISKFLI